MVEPFWEEVVARDIVARLQSRAVGSGGISVHLYPDHGRVD